jgi:tRNA(Ile2) C34 agmatinyltransferase TiaS
MKCPKCKNSMKSNVEEESYVCPKCKEEIKWGNPIKIHKIPRLKKF